MSRKIQLRCLLLLLGLLSIAAQSSFAQADPPLNQAQKFSVRGDFVVAGAYNLTSRFTSMNGQSYAVGTISVPDPNPGITGQNMVPPGGEVMAAVLYWQTVEKVGVMLGQAGSGQIGFFRPLIPGGPKAPGYQITGVPLGGNNTVSWSDGGCTSGSTGKAVRTYRANVLNALPRDANGNILANGQYEVRLPGTSSTTPIAVLGTLVLVYRMLDSSVPQNLILFYDGDTATSASSMTMTQTHRHFYDAAHNPVSRLAYIVGGGKSKKTETVSLNGMPLQPLYPGQPPFIGFYGTGDNPVWTFGNPNVPAGPNPILEDSDAAISQVMASGANPGCQSIGAIILSTTVKNTDGDGLPDAVKIAPPGYANPGYCDADIMCTPGDPNWVDLPGAVLGKALMPHPDVYVQLDYMCSSPNADGLTCKTGDGINYSFDPTLQTDPVDGLNAVQKVVNVYAAHGITLHVNPPGTNQPNVHAIQEPGCQDTMVNGQLSLCTFPHPSTPSGNTINLGVVAWPGDVYGFERQLIDKDEPLNLSDCATPLPAEENNEPGDCVPRFQPAAAFAKHYGLFAHAVGQPKWFIFNGTLASVTQTDNTVTFTTSTPVGALNMLVDERGNSALDPSCNNGRVTVIGAITNSNLNGTHCVNPGFNPAGTMFTITVSGPKTSASYTLATDPNLAVVPPFTSTASGVADVGGHHFVVSLGRWEDPASPNSDGQNALVIGGTILHEGGHGLLSLAHGGPTSGAAANPQLFKSVTTNCKPNYFSVMSYSRQVDGVLDYSEGILSDLNKATQTGNLTSAGSAIASWYVPFPAAVDANGNPIGSPAKLACPGGPIPAGEPPMTRVTGPANTFSFVVAPDPNYDGITNEDLQGKCDWCNVDLGQNGATAAIASSSGGQFGGGGGQFGGGGGQFGGGGGQFGGGGGQFGGGGGQFGGGGGQFGGGGGQFGGGGEIDLATAESITHAITDLKVVSEGVSPRTITLKWSKPFGDIGAYNVYRSADRGNTFTRIASVSGNPPAATFTDTVTCNPIFGYQYFVTAVQSATSPFPLEESTPSNTVSTVAPDTTDPLTGCYIVTGFSSPASSVQGSAVPITWTLTDDFYPTGGAVTRQAANTLVAIGPLPNNCTTLGRTRLLADGIPTNAADMFNNSGDQFTFTWNSTDAFCAGSYTFELNLDHVPASQALVPAQVQATTSALQLNIDVTDTDSTPHITTTFLPDAVVGTLYSNTLTQDGGTPSFTWIVTSGLLPPGITLGTATGTLSGTPTTPGIYTFTVQVTDSLGNFGAQTLTLRVLQPFFGQTIDPVDASGQPDLVWGAVMTTGDGNVKLMVRFASGTFNSSTTLADVELDTDQNPATGSPGSDSGCSNDRAVFGDDYLVQMQSGFGGNQALIYKATGSCNSFVQIGTAPVTILSDGMDVTFPLSLLSNTPSATTSGPATSGPWNFKVTTASNIGGNNFTGVLDYMPPVGQVASTAPAPLPVAAPAGLVAWWPADGYLTDIQGHLNTTITGNVGYAPSEVGQGFQTGAAGSVVTAQDSPTLALTQFSIGAWVQVNAIDNVETMQVVWKGNSNSADVSTPYSLSVVGNVPFAFSANAVQFGTPGPGKVLVMLGDGTNEVDVFSTNALSLGTFHYVAVTSDGQNANLYIDGVLDGVSPASESSLTLPFTNTNPLQIGGVLNGGPPGNGFDGIIDELQIWNRALTAAEVASIFNAGAAGCNKYQ